MNDEYRVLIARLKLWTRFFNILSRHAKHWTRGALTLQSQQNLMALTRSLNIFSSNINFNLKTINGQDPVMPTYENRHRPSTCHRFASHSIWPRQTKIRIPRHPLYNQRYYIFLLITNYARRFNFNRLITLNTSPEVHILQFILLPCSSMISIFVT